MKTIKVYVRRIEVNHHGYCSEADEEYKYENENNFDIITLKYGIYEKTPIDLFDKDGFMKEDYWYDYVPWDEDEVRDEEFFLGAYHCHCCTNYGTIYRIFRVRNVEMYNDDMELFEHELKQEIKNRKEDSQEEDEEDSEEDSPKLSIKEKLSGYKYAFYRPGSNILL